MKHRLYYLFGLVLILGLRPILWAQDSGYFWGRILGPDRSPRPGIKIILARNEKRPFRETWSDENGQFQFCGLPQDSYLIHCQSGGSLLSAARPLDIGGDEKVFAEMTLPSSEQAQAFIAMTVLRDYPVFSSSTVIDESQRRLLPSTDSIWSLIENQDFSATTNRIDVGGLWNNTPALFSARGGTSWTQNKYLLDGMDVTDPVLGGAPLYVPDYWSLQTFSLENAGHSARFMTPGGLVGMTIKDGGDVFKGSVATNFSDKILSSSNITPALEKEKLFENNTLNNSLEGHFDLSGPVIPGKLSFITSWTGLKISRNIAEFPEDDKSSLSSGLVRLKSHGRRSSWSILWTGQETHNASFGAGRNVPFGSTLDQKNYSNILQAAARFRLTERHLLEAGAGYGRSDSHGRFQNGAQGPSEIEIFHGVVSGTAPEAGEDRRDLLTFFVHGQLFGTKRGAQNQFEYGAEFKKASSVSKHEIMENIQLRFFENAPLEVVKFNTPLEHRESSIEASAYAQETLTRSNFFTATLGVHLNFSRGRVPGEKSGITWFHAAPRVGVAFPLSKLGKSSFRIFAGRYYFNLALDYLTYGNPQALGGLVYRWQDRNGNRIFEDGEAGRLIRREGPYYARIDSSLKRPYTDELSLSFVRQSGSGFYFSVTGFIHETRNLIATINTRVPFSSYEPQTITDIGDDRIPGTPDDLTFDLFNQRERTMGQDFLLLSNPGGSQVRSSYQGFDIVFYRKTSSRFTYFVSLTATRAVGTTSPGNTEWENDDGIVGTLYDNPNTLVNAKGRLRFDRAYTGRVGFAIRLPLGISLGYVLKYYDGQPFARKIVVTGFRQGPFIIMAHPRGVARYEFNMTHDIRLQKAIPISHGILRIIFDGFNILNQHLATGENEWTNDDFPLRFATEIESPRIFRLGLSYEF